MGKLWLWGAGKNLGLVMDYINKGVEVKGIFDKNRRLYGEKAYGITIMEPQKALLSDKDVVLVTVAGYEDVLRDAAVLLEVNDGQIVSFWNGEYEIERLGDFLDINRWRKEIQIPYLKFQIRNLQLKIDNGKYEVAEKLLSDPPVFPIIKEGVEALNRVYHEKKSLCRYGDGEFEIIFGRERASFQACRTELQERLLDVLVNRSDKVITCIANNYGCLGEYTETAANAIREYMTSDVRENHMHIIDLEKEYYDAYISRPYIIYKNRTKASQIFALWKKLWQNRDIVIVEGVLSRNGYGNDLFQNCSSIERILCPAENAWDFYHEIYHYIEDNVEKDKLLLIALGPAATVLAYDLAMKGYQAIDMGHLDNEYEWYLKGTKERVNITYKYVAECKNGTQVDAINDDEFESQIVKYIGCGK